MITRGAAVRVFDAYPLAALLLGETGGRAAQELLSESIAESAVSAINVAEIIDLVARSRSVPAAQVVTALEWWRTAGLQVVAVSRATSCRAADLRAQHYHRSRSPVSLADCCAIALAEELGATLVTSDGPMLRIAELIGVRVEAVPDSRGSVPGSDG
jgi:uncharacterized protein with PIN domain